MIPHCIAVVAGKGGVLKTTAAAHLAGLAAAAGWSVLLVDGDPQGSAAFDLGYEADHGMRLRDAILDREPLVPIATSRQGLQVIPGGPQLDEVCVTVGNNQMSTRWLDEALAPIANQFDLIVIDSPPREMALRRMILTTAHYLVIPSGVDRASREGLPDAARTVNEIRMSQNPDLDVLGVFAGPVGLSSTKIRDRVILRLGEVIGDPDLVFDTVVRYAPLVAEECRERGILTHEYAEAAANAAPWYEAIKTGDESYSSAAAGVAGDWHRLTNEILSRFVAAQDRWAAAAVPLVAATPGPN